MHWYACVLHATSQSCTCVCVCAPNGSATDIDECLSSCAGNERARFTRNLWLSIAFQNGIQCDSFCSIPQRSNDPHPSCLFLFQLTSAAARESRPQFSPTKHARSLSLSALSLSRLSKLCNTHKSWGNSHFILLKYVHTYIVIYIYSHTYMGSSAHTHARDERTNERTDGHRFGVRAIGATFHLKAIHHNVCTVLYLYCVCCMLHGHCPHSPRLVGLDENWSSARARARQALGSASHRSAQVVHILFARSAPTQPT